MTEPDTTAMNAAAGSAQVGVQAGVVHGDVIYTSSPDDSPEKNFRTGVSLLDGGVAPKARPLIHEAVIGKHITNEVYFYFLLSLVSGRTRHELSAQETAWLKNPPEELRLIGNDEWADGVRTVRRLLDSAQKPEADLRVLLVEFDKLGDAQKRLITKHMELFLDGSLQEQMWDRALRRAELDQMVDERADRVWKFFEPAPQPPRPGDPRKPVTPFATRAQAVTGAIVFAAATIHIGFLLAQAGRVVALVAYLLSLIAGYFGVRDSMEWRFRNIRRRTKDQEYAAPRQRRTSAPPGGFARKVDQRFDYYFNKYVPRGVERSSWITATAGIRKSIRDEIVETYREQRIGVERIAWLIRHRVLDIKSRWENGTLWNYQKELQTPLPTRARAVLGIAIFVAVGTWSVGNTLPASPQSASLSAALALVGGWIAARTWLHIILEHRQYTADKIENKQTQKLSEAAFHKWTEKLADKPDDREIAAWLDCDRKVLLNEALQHYKLTISNIIAYAFIEAPAASTKRARVQGGPWRYTKYRLLIFLLTTDGVRQFTANLNFEHGTFHDRERTNYRYEAVAAVRVTQADSNERTFELTLINGQEINIQVIGAGMEELQQNENPGTVTEVTLDAAGLHHTLHVLEGIAAEGKKWIIHENRRTETRTRKPHGD